MSSANGASATKRPRRTRAEMEAMREAIVELTELHERMTVRGIFYALVSQGIVPKDEVRGYRPVQRQVLTLRRSGALPWAFVADGTRWVRRVDTFESADLALEEVARNYRRDLWLSQDWRLEVWLEKDALADLIWPVASRWGVPLYVSRGVPSETIVHSAARDACGSPRRTKVLALFDHDAGGARAFRKIESGFGEYGEGQAEVERLALTAPQIEAWKLPTRPAKASDPEAAKWGDRPAVELDALPPEGLTALLDEAISRHVDTRAWHIAQVAERQEREGLLALTGGRG